MIQWLEEFTHMELVMKKGFHKSGLRSLSNYNLKFTHNNSMKKMFALCTLLAIAFPFLVGVAWPDNNSVKSYEQMWSVENLQLPENMKVLFEKDDIGGFSAEGCRYTVFQLKKEPTKFLEKMNFKSYTVRVDRKPFRGYFAWGDLITPNVQEKYLPDYDKEYMWTTLRQERFEGHRYDLLCMLYFPHESRLYMFHTNSALGRSKSYQESRYRIGEFSNYTSGDGYKSTVHTVNYFGDLDTRKENHFVILKNSQEMKDYVNSVLEFSKKNIEEFPEYNWEDYESRVQDFYSLCDDNFFKDKALIVAVIDKGNNPFFHNYNVKGINCNNGLLTVNLQPICVGKSTNVNTRVLLLELDKTKFDISSIQVNLANIIYGCTCHKN